MKAAISRLYMMPGASAEDLARAMGVSRSSVKRHLGNLHGRGDIPWTS